MRTLAAAVLLLAVGLALPDLASACAACVGDGGEASRLTYRITTALLTFVPLLAFGTVLTWLWRRARSLERESHGSEPAPGLEPLP